MSAHRRPSVSSLFTTTEVACVDLQKTQHPLRTGLGYFDHMMDQINSHAQIGVGLTVHHHSDFSSLSNKTKAKKTTTTDGDEGDEEEPYLHNRLAVSTVDQASLLRHVGWTIGSQMMLMPKFLGLDDDVTATSRFCCPLDEALVECVLTKPVATNKKRRLEEDGSAAAKVAASVNVKPVGELVKYELAPFGVFPKSTGRTKIGCLETVALEEFFKAFSRSTGLEISLTKVRGDNGHHIVESTFKAFSRAMRNLLDGTDTREVGKKSKQPQSSSDQNQSDSHMQQAMWGPTSMNWKQSIALKREGSVERSTKETKINVKLALDGGAAGVNISTGIQTLDEFFTILAAEACMSLNIDCKGDLWVDDHHTAEDVAIAVGQVLTTALGTKAGLNRMWCARETVASDGDGDGSDQFVEVTMDLSNRPCLTHNLALEDAEEEMIEDLSVEMLDHVLDSLVVNGRMTVHIVLSPASSNSNSSAALKNRAMATAAAFGKALKFCAMVDHRRAGTTASSKGTLSV